VVPIVLAIVLALVLLSYRVSFPWHKQPKTWKDDVSEGLHSAKSGLNEGLRGYYEAAKEYVGDASARGQGMAHEKLDETGEYLKGAVGNAQDRVKAATEAAHGKAKSAAGAAHEKIQEQAHAASDYAHAKGKEAYDDAKAKVSDAYDSASDPNILHRASEYIQDKASSLLHRGKTLSAEAAEELAHQKNLAAENVRHFAAEAELKASEKLNSVRDSANDLKRNVKSKVGL